MPKSNPNESTKTLDIVNTGMAPHVVHDNYNQPVRINPGQSAKVELHSRVAEKIARGSDQGGPLKVGNVAKQYLERQRYDQERAEHEAQERAQRDDEARQHFQTREVTNADDEETDAGKRSK